jgi:L-fuconolactonase
MTVVDAHHHLWDLGAEVPAWLAAPALAPIRRSYRLADLRRHTGSVGVQATVLVQTVPDLDETRAFLAEAAASEGLIVGVVGWVDLTDPELSDTLTRLAAGPGGHLLVGIRHQVQDEDDPRWLLRPEVLRGLAAVASAGLVYDLLVLPHQLEVAAEAVEAVPEGRFVLDHGAKPPIRQGELGPWSHGIRRLAGNEHVACKLSGLITEADWTQWTVADLRPYADVLLEAFGPQRLMFGSDWPVCELAGTYEQVWGAAERLVPAEAREAVFGATAQRWYRLRG